MICVSIILYSKTQLKNASFYTYTKATYTTPKPTPTAKAGTSSEGRRKLQINYTYISLKLIQAKINSSSYIDKVKGCLMVHLPFIL